MNQWVSFDELEARVSIEDVLDHYKVADLRRRRDELIGICPFHDETKGSFSANVVTLYCCGTERKGKRTANGSRTGGAETSVAIRYGFA